MNKTNRLIERRVTYTLEVDGRFYVVENVPARVDEQTGEQFFAPHTAERLQAFILGYHEPRTVAEARMYDYNE